MSSSFLRIKSKSTTYLSGETGNADNRSGVNNATNNHRPKKAAMVWQKLLIQSWCPQKNIQLFIEYVLGWSWDCIFSQLMPLDTAAAAAEESMSVLLRRSKGPLQGRRRVWKSGGGTSRNVVGHNLPIDYVTDLPTSGRGRGRPPAPRFRHPFVPCTRTSCSDAWKQLLSFHCLPALDWREYYVA